MEIKKITGNWYAYQYYNYAIVINRKENNAWEKYNELQDSCNRIYGVSCEEVGKRNPKWNRDIRPKQFQFYFSEKKYLDMALLSIGNI